MNKVEGHPRIDDDYIICPYCEAKYQPESEDLSEDIRQETCYNCGESYISFQRFDIKHYSYKIQRQIQSSGEDTKQ